MGQNVSFVPLATTMKECIQILTLMPKFTLKLYTYYRKKSNYIFFQITIISNTLDNL